MQNEHNRAQKQVRKRAPKGAKERLPIKIANDQVWNNQVWELPQRRCPTLDVPFLEGQFGKHVWLRKTKHQELTPLSRPNCTVVFTPNFASLWIDVWATYHWQYAGPFGSRCLPTCEIPKVHEICLSLAWVHLGTRTPPGLLQVRFYCFRPQIRQLGGFCEPCGVMWEIVSMDSRCKGWQWSCLWEQANSMESFVSRSREASKVSRS